MITKRPLIVVTFIVTLIGMATLSIVPMRRKLIVFSGVAVGIVALAVAATFTPTFKYDPYDPRLVTTPVRTSAESAAQTIEEFLRRSGQLPWPGTELVRHDGILDWKAAPRSGVRITDVEVEWVRLTAGAPLLMSILDDDATYWAEVGVRVTTSDGQRTTLSVKLWDYGLLTPWSLHAHGDGWKPVQIHWPKTGTQGPNE